MSNQHKRIAIIGAGPGGLTLARILQQAGYSPVVYESDPYPAFREQGGTLDLDQESGQKALQMAGLLDQFHAICRFEGQALKLSNKRGNILLDAQGDLDPTEHDRPEIDRSVLRTMLLDSLQPNSIQWGYKLLKAVPLDQGKHELRFENGFTETVDLVIAADGAFSKARPLVSDATAEYSGVSMIELNILNAAAQFPELAAFNGMGSMYALGDHKGIMAQLNGDKRIRVYLGFQVERDWLEQSNIPFENLEEAKKEILPLFEDWDEQLKSYIRCANGTITPRRIYMLPVPHQWEHKSGVTLIGDAAHLMSPFAGAGANLAMLDAAELANSIINHADLDKAVQEYETKMFEYAAETATVTQSNMELFFSDNAIEALCELMSELTIQA
ncbi:FAD-dependent oxidoreductase [Paenibacillus taichungensis]|uniref:FAD-dependent oxidoreductase n=1 Tax=Paenibacillus taichungensis TaxID=484184 RepID=UPI003800F297